MSTLDDLNKEIAERRKFKSICIICRVKEVVRKNRCLDCKDKSNSPEEMPEKQKWQPVAGWKHLRRERK